jgi:hypothetical protein
MNKCHYAKAHDAADARVILFGANSTHASICRIGILID